MGYRLERDAPAGDEARRVATEQLEEALSRLDRIAAGEAVVEHEVHEIRKRCKEVRALARLVRPGLDGGFRAVDRRVRRAARELSSIRDSHAALQTLEKLEGAGDRAPGSFDHAHGVLARRSTRASDKLRGHRSVARARARLSKARQRTERWALPADFDPVARGLETTYRKGRRSMERCRARATDVRMHAWRRWVKRLGYQLRLLEGAARAPSPHRNSLEELADVLGDNHDLAVLIEHLEASPRRYGGEQAVRRMVRAARERQQALRESAFRLGAIVFDEPVSDFVARIGAGWRSAPDA